MSEKTLSIYCKNILKDKVYWDRIECISKDGIPDVFYFIKPLGPWGVIELKYLASFPKNDTIKLNHLTNQQILWMSTRGPCIKQAFMLLKIENTFNLIRWNNVFRFKKFTKEDLVKYSYRRWIGNLEKESFLTTLKNGG